MASSVDKFYGAAVAPLPIGVLAADDGTQDQPEAGGMATGPDGSA